MRIQPTTKEPRSERRGDEREVRDLGGEGLAVIADIAIPGQVEAAAQRAEHAFGDIDVWVNDAMATVFAPVGDVSPAEFARATDVTYLGYVYGTMAALRRMVPRDRGTIVQVGSALAYRAIPLQSAYCAAVRCFDLTRTTCGPPGLLSDEFEVGQRQLPRADAGTAAAPELAGAGTCQ